MLLSVRHVTTYAYAQPVRRVVQSLRLTPTDCASQTHSGWTIEVSDAVEGSRFRDGCGDLVRAFTVRGPVEQVRVTVSGTVTTTDTAGILKGHKESVPVVAWLTETPATAPDAGLRELAAAATGGDALALAHDLSRRVADAIVWTPGATDARTTAAEALALGKGVCQDHAQALICAARLRELPARYVTGYLFSAAETGEAAHAWAEIWIEGLGWVGFDPANRCCPDERHIRLACGRDAAGAAPVRGTVRGTAEESTQIAVAVAQAQQ
jgi:transglutaminase-like putative cysteine protease